VCWIRIQKSRVVKIKQPNAEWRTGAEWDGTKMQNGQKKEESEINSASKTRDRGHRSRLGSIG
jgi:hypothetical protein